MLKTSTSLLSLLNWKVSTKLSLLVDCNLKTHIIISLQKENVQFLSISLEILHLSSTASCFCHTSFNKDKPFPNRSVSYFPCIFYVAKHELQSEEYLRDTIMKEWIIVMWRKERVIKESQKREDLCPLNEKVLLLSYGEKIPQFLCV